MAKPNELRKKQIRIMLSDHGLIAATYLTAKSNLNLSRTIEAILTKEYNDALEAERYQNDISK